MSTTQVGPSTEWSSPEDVPPRILRRATIAGTIGSVVEWFDVAVYAYLATVIGEIFFPNDDPTVSLLSAFAVFAAAFAVRPLGGIFFGMLGDRLGRRHALVWVIGLVSVSTFAIGLLPGYASVGVVAPVLLVAVRLLQGFSAGGEMGGASAFVMEHCPRRRRGHLVAWVEMGCILGFLLGSLVVLFLRLGMSPEQLSSWGWRLPFFVAAPLGLIGFYIRMRLEETPEFTALRRRQELAKNSLVESVRDHWPAVLRTGGYALFQNVALYIILTFIPSYISTTLGQTPLLGSVSSVVSMAVICLLIPPMGALSDRLGRRPVLGASCGLSIVCAYPLFALMGAGSTASVIIGHAALGVLLAMFLGPTLTAMNEMFDTRVRYGGFSLGYNVSVSLFGGTAPFIVAWAIARSGDQNAPAFYVMLAAAVTLAVVLTARETAPRRARAIVATDTLA